MEVPRVFNLIIMTFYKTKPLYIVILGYISCSVLFLVVFKNYDFHKRWDIPGTLSAFHVQSGVEPFACEFWICINVMYIWSGSDYSDVPTWINVVQSSTDFYNMLNMIAQQYRHMLSEVEYLWVSPVLTEHLCNQTY